MAHEPLRTALHHLRRAIQSPEAVVSDARLVERFVTARDEAAFELLVRRHERLVLSVCRRVLRDGPDAEDAFQATFLVFVRKAASIGKRESVAAWLYKVAYRVALRARAGSARGARHERPGADLPSLAAPEAPDAAWRELRPLLDQEVNRLPEKYRRPVVLCYLESRTYDEAARELGCSRGTVSTRLTRARELLRRRLARRGLALSVALLTTLLIERPAAAGVPAGLADGAVRAALLVAAGRAADGLVSAKVVSLMEGALHAMVATKRKVLAGILLAVAVAGAGTGTLTYRAFAAGQDQDPNRAAARPYNVLEGTDQVTPPLRKAPAEPPAAFGWRERAVLTDNTDNVLSVTFSPDGKRLASANLDGVADLWDVASGKLVRRITTERLYSTAFSPDGRVLATAGNKRSGLGVVQVWDLGTGRQVSALAGNPGAFDAVAFAPDGRLLATGSRDGTVRLWDVAQNREQQSLTLQGPSLPILAVTFSPDGKRLAAASGEEVVRPDGRPGAVTLWDVASGKVATIRGQDGTVAAVAFSPDGKTLVSAGADKTVRLWDPATGKELRQFAGTNGFIRRVAFSPDGKLLASTSTDGAVRLWDVATGKLILTLRGSVNGPTSCVAFSPDGRFLAAGGHTDKGGGYVILWERVPVTPRLVQPGMPPLTVAGHSAPANRLERLLQDMLQSQRSDQQIVDGLFLATLARYPSDTERKFVLDSLDRHKDRGAAFAEVLATLTNSREFRTNVEALEKHLAERKR
jgi:RNA polymerase sigma factor (sigma-70 family)